MNPYIRNYKINKIETELCENINEYNKIESETKPDFAVFHLNIRSLSKNIDELLIFLQQFNKKFDAIILSETFQIFDICLFHIDGYELVYNRGALNKNDGVVVYVKSCYTFQQKIDKIGDIDAITININIQPNIPLTITAVYRPPSTNVYNFNANLLNYLTNLKLKGTHILAGDMNINILSEINDFVQDYLNILHTHGFVSYINKHTRIQNESKSCIDHFFVKCEMQSIKINSLIFEQNITDHFPIVLFLKLEKNRNTNVPENQFKKYINYEKIKNSLRDEKWTEIYSSDDVDEIAEMLTNKLQTTIDINTRLIKIKKSEKREKNG